MDFIEIKETRDDLVPHRQHTEIENFSRNEQLTGDRTEVKESYIGVENVENFESASDLNLHKLASADIPRLNRAKKPLPSIPINRNFEKSSQEPIINKSHLESESFVRENLSGQLQKPKSNCNFLLLLKFSYL